MKLVVRTDMTSNHLRQAIKHMAFNYDGTSKGLEARPAAIKMARAVFVMSLKEAKDWVEAGCPTSDLSNGDNILFSVDSGQTTTQGVVLDTKRTAQGRFYIVIDAYGYIYSVKGSNVLN